MSGLTNKEAGRRPYVNTRKGSKGTYVEEMRKATEKGLADMALEINFHIPQSEFKKPYASPTYQGMEHYGKPEVPPGPPPVLPPEYPPTTPPPVPPVPPPGPTPPTPGPTPTPPPSWTCQGCWGPMGIEKFCRNGDPIPITPIMTCKDDPIVGVTVSGGGGIATVGPGGRTVIYTPDDSSGAFLTLHTKSGLSCFAVVSVKPDSECPQPVDCSGITINYTTVQMGVGESQELSYTPVAGCDCVWNVDGGGTIEGTGSTVTYTAPATNVNCAGNPTITLICGGKVVDYINLAVNAVSGDAGFYVYCSTSRALGICAAFIASKYVQCNGQINPYYENVCSGQFSQECTLEEMDAILAALCATAWSNYTAGPLCPGAPTGPEVIDTRTEAQIAAGCCPYQFM